MKVANPQGKGLVVIAQHWHPVAQYNDDISYEETVNRYFFSLLVLSAKFRFKPVYGNNYYLYLKREELHLTLIEPETSGERFGEYIGEAKLNPDITWRVKFASAEKLTEEAKRFLTAFYDGFAKHHDQKAALTSLLPFYEEQRPFYARVFASGLANSIQHSLNLLEMPNLRACDLTKPTSLYLDNLDSANTDQCT